MDSKQINKVNEIFKQCTAKPELFLSKQQKFSEKFKKATKILYDLSIQSGPKNFKIPSQLVVNGFDLEQIWQQIELKNQEYINRCSVEISKFKFKHQNDCESAENIENNDSNEAYDDSENDEVSQNESFNDNVDDADETDHKTLSNQSQKIKKSIVDDKFFKLSQLDEFLKAEDKKEEKLQNKKTESDFSDDDDNESIDLFKEIPDEPEKEGDVDEARLLKYEDFFDVPYNEEDNEYNDNNDMQNNSNENAESDDNQFEEENEEFEEENEEFAEEQQNEDEKMELDGELDDEEEDEEEDNERHTKKKVKFNLTEDNSSENDSDDNEDGSEMETEEANDQVLKSSLETRQDRLKERIKNLEKEAISEKPWQLKGEVTATKRPQNSLLEEFVEFDVVSRPAPLMTEETTMKLEDIILMRIKDKAWDDVEKKFKPVETPLEYKKKLIMNQEKSKESLAQIYENEYIKQREALTTDKNEEKEKEEPPEQIEIREMMHSLFRKLDALSNYHYTPKMAKPELKIISNIPAVNMEEVAPVGTSDATLLAPEEIKGKIRGELIGKSERTKTDKLRERRKKKQKQKAHVKNKVQEENDTPQISKGKIKKKNAKENSALLKNLKKQRNVINLNESNEKQVKAIKSSSAFFEQLQDEVRSSIKAKTVKNDKKNKNSLSASKLKL